MMTKRYFRNLVYIECSYSDQDDLIKLHLEQAKQVYILTYTVENSNVSDSGILPLIKIIEENFPYCNYTLELSDELNVRYMNNKGLDSGSDGDYKLNFIGEASKGRVIKNKDKVKNTPVQLMPKFAKSDIFFCSSIESLLAFSYHNDGFLEVLSKLLGIDNDSNTISENKVPENPDITMYRYVGKDKLKYESAIYLFLNLEKPIIPIAIYRMRNDPALKNKLPYIITNPEKNFMLNRFDKIICIGETSIKEHFRNFSEDEFSDMQKDDDCNYSDSSCDSRRIGRRPSRRQVFKDVRGVKVSSKNNLDIEDNDLENLNEEELLEKLKIEINNLKDFSQVNNPKNSSNGLFPNIKINNQINFNNTNPAAEVNNNIYNVSNNSENRNSIYNENDLLKDNNYYKIGFRRGESSNLNSEAARYDISNNNIINNKLKKNFYSNDIHNIIEEEKVEDHDDINFNNIANIFISNTNGLISLDEQDLKKKTDLINPPNVASNLETPNLSNSYFTV